MATSASKNNRYETCLPPADEMPIMEPSPPDKSILVRYLVSGARRILNLRDETDPETLSTAIHAATRRLAAAKFILEDHPEDRPAFESSVPDWPHRAKPDNQAAFHAWARATFLRVFRLEKQPDGPKLPIDAPFVRGLTVYAARTNETRFYGAWTAASGVFIGWMRIQPQVTGVESDYAVGEVLGRSVFPSVSIDLSGHDAEDRFVQALEEAAWDLGLAGG